MAFRTIFIIALFSLHAAGFAQIRLFGEVSHDHNGIPRVTIKVIEDDDVLRTFMVDRKGRYETQIPFNRQYTLVFTRPFMFPVSIEIDSRVDFTEEVVYEVPLNMKMFYRYEGINDKPFDQPIGVVKQTGKGVDAFSFIPDVAVVEELKDLQAQSKLKEKQEANPVEKTRLDQEMQAFAFSERSTKEVITTDKAETLENANINEESPAIDEEVGKISALDVKSNRFEVMETSKDIEQQSARDLKSSAQSSGESLRSVEKDHQYRIKKYRYAYEVEEAEKDATLADARASKSEKYAYGPSDNSSAVTQSTQKEPYVVKLSIDDGTFIVEERLLVDIQGRRYEFKKSIYNWVVFEWVNYSKDDLEISKEEYEAIRALVDI